jgi:hypothetical protein
MNRTRIAPLVALLLIVVSCSGETMKDLEATPPAGLERIMNSRVFFGHQSVGFGLVEGMREAASRWGAGDLAVTESRAAEPAGPRLFHAVIGENTDPIGKILDFEGVIRRGMGGGVSIAFMKLCYADIMVETDVGPIFAFYRDTMTRLATDYPGTTFVHVTVPLLRRDRGLKLIAKRLIGRQVRGHEDNEVREALNDLLREEYAATGTLFDLARLESGDGAQPRALLPSYTDDGGHLNETGSLVLGGKLLAFLAGLAD